VSEANESASIGAELSSGEAVASRGKGGIFNGAMDFANAREQDRKMKARYFIVLFALLLGCVVLHAMDPFYTDEQLKSMVEAYKKREPLQPRREREAHGIPFGLAIQQVRLPAFILSGVNLPQAVRQLRDQLVTEEPSFADVTWVLDLDAASSSAVITLDLKDVSALEVLRYVTELGGAGYSLVKRQFTIGVEIKYRNSWRTPHIRNFSLSENLAARWFPKVSNRLPSAPLWQAEKLLDKMGIPFWDGAQADFVPRMNVLSVVHCTVAHHCLETLIDETEAELTIRKVQADPKSKPSGMELKALDVSDFDHASLKKVLWKKDGLIHPDSVSTKDAISSLGVIFPAGSAIWFERSKKLLHVLNRPELIEAIQAMLDKE
jgi:hypothetical protein